MPAPARPTIRPPATAPRSKPAWAGRSDQSGDGDRPDRDHRRGRPRLPPSRRQPGRVPDAGGHGRRRRRLRLRRRRRPRPLLRRLRRERDRAFAPRAATACIVARPTAATPTSPRRPGSAIPVAAWAARSATSTTTATSICSSATGEPDTLWRNDGDGTLHRRVARRSASATPGFGTSAVFFDYDRDGWLDLFVARYVDFDPALRCTQEGGRRDYCGPTQFEAVHDLLYRNERGERFRDVSREAGIDERRRRRARRRGRRLRRRRLARPLRRQRRRSQPPVDQPARRHLRRERDGPRRRLQRVRRGGGRHGHRRGRRRRRRRPRPLRHPPHRRDQHALPQPREPSGFDDATAASGLGPPGAGYTGFGTALFDLDNDGDLDTAVANGGVKRRPRAGARRARWLLAALRRAQPAVRERRRRQVRRRRPRGAGASPLAWGSVELGRGLLPFDHDGDGDLDLLVTTIDGPARLYRNDGGDARRPGSRSARSIPRSTARRSAPRSRRAAGDRRWVRHAIPPGRLSHQRRTLDPPRSGRGRCRRSLRGALARRIGRDVRRARRPAARSSCGAARARPRSDGAADDSDLARHRRRALPPSPSRLLQAAENVAAPRPRRRRAARRGEDRGAATRGGGQAARRRSVGPLRR